MTTQEILQAFPKLSALVIGDICLDRWCTYDPATAEPSRETGIPRIGVVATEVTPGAGGTVANNLAALRVGRVSVLGAIGEDGFGFELVRALETRGIEAGLLVQSSLIQTFTYTKILNRETGQEDRPRIDYINTRPLDPAVEAELVSRLREAARDYDVILVSDQAETESGGVVTATVRQALAALADTGARRLVWVDSRMRPECFRGAIVKPNEQEARMACMRVFGTVDYAALRELTEAPALIVTHGGDGALVVDGSGQRWVAARKVAQPVDICGAGDSFSAGAAMALAATGDAVAAAAFGNRVASVTIMKKGTGTATPAEVLAAE
jgi:rfaE bifunctional protein kinase chain/domain